MSPTAPTKNNSRLNIPAAPAPSAKKGKLQKLNARALALQKAAERVYAELESYCAAVSPEDLKSKTGLTLTAARQDSAKVASTAAELPKHLFRLNELKWEPPVARSGSAFKAGDVVTLRDRRVERFTKNGAYEAKALARLKVVSVHGDQCKIEIESSKEPLGLVAASWLSAAKVAEKAAPKAAEKAA